MDIIGLIPARGGSKGIPNKNMTILCGKPLIDYTFCAVKESKLLSRAILSTDDESIAGFGTDSGIEVPFLRPPELAQDETSMIEVAIHLLHYLKNKEGKVPEFLMILQPTSPLRTAQHIDEACKLISKTENLETVVSVCEMPHNYHPGSIYRLREGVLFDYEQSTDKVYDRHKKTKLYARNGPAILISSNEVINKKHSFYGSKIIPYLMQPESSIDINDPFDLMLVEYILSRKIGKKP